MTERVSGRVIAWPGRAALNAATVSESVERILAMFHAIEAGEHLSALPDCVVARSHHATAMRLLANAERELFDVYSEIADHA